MHHRVQVGCGGRAALALLRSVVELGDLVGARPLLPLAVEIGVGGDLRLGAGVDEGPGDGARGRLVGDLQRPAGGVVVAGAALVVLGLQEIGLDGVPVPALGAEIGPEVVILGLAADVEHGVDGRRAAERLAARLEPAAAVQPGLRHRLEGPVVDLRPARDHRRDQRRGADEEVLAGAAGLDQADRDGRVLAEPRRQHRAGRAAAGNHVIEFHAWPPSRTPRGHTGGGRGRGQAPRGAGLSRNRGPFSSLRRGSRGGCGSGRPAASSPPDAPGPARPAGRGVPRSPPPRRGCRRRGS